MSTTAYQIIAVDFDEPSATATGLSSANQTDH